MESSNHGLILIRPPGPLAKEFALAERNRQVDLYNTTIRLYRELIPVPEIRQEIVSGGWSSEFADWYTGEMDRHGCYLEIVVEMPLLRPNREVARNSSRKLGTLDPQILLIIDITILLTLFHKIGESDFPVFLLVAITYVGFRIWLAQNRRLH